MLIRRSGYPARLGIETTARVVRDHGLHNARGVHCVVAAQTGNQHVQETFFSLKKTTGANPGNGTLTPRDSVQELPDWGVFH